MELAKLDNCPKCKEMVYDQFAHVTDKNGKVSHDDCDQAAAELKSFNEANQEPEGE